MTRVTLYLPREIQEYGKDDSVLRRLGCDIAPRPDWDEESHKVTLPEGWSSFRIDSKDNTIELTQHNTAFPFKNGWRYILDEQERVRISILERPCYLGAYRTKACCYVQRYITRHCEFDENSNTMHWFLCGGGEKVIATFSTKWTSPQDSFSRRERIHDQEQANNILVETITKKVFPDFLDPLAYWNEDNSEKFEALAESIRKEFKDAVLLRGRNGPSPPAGKQPKSGGDKSAGLHYT